MSSVTPNIPNADSTTAKAPSSQTSFRLVPSALLFTASSPIPVGIRARDMSTMVQGLVEEHAPLPLDQTSWGFILDNKTRQTSHYLYYAAPRDLIFKSTAESNDSSLKLVVPSFVATTGLQFKHATWLCLLEAECLSLLYFEAGSSIPDKIHSQFFSNGDTPQNAETIRKELITKHASSTPKSEEILDGFIRIESTVAKGRQGIQFKLGQAATVDGPWQAWKQSTIAQPTRLVAADLRTKESLSTKLQHKQSSKRIGIVAAFVMLAIIILAYFEFSQIKKQTEAQRLAYLAAEQQPLVDQLKEVETMTKSLKDIFQKEFHPFHWLMIINELRSNNLSISSYSLDDSGELTAHGEANEVKALNLFVNALKINPKFNSVTLANLNTDNAGVTFSLKLVTGDMYAESATIELEATAPEAPPPETPTEAVTTPETTNTPPEKEEPQS
jgi:hypothetical protein